VTVDARCSPGGLWLPALGQEVSPRAMGRLVPAPPPWLFRLAGGHSHHRGRSWWSGDRARWPLSHGRWC